MADEINVLASRLAGDVPIRRGVLPTSSTDLSARVSLGLLYLVLVYTPWNFKFISSLPRLVSVESWWIPLVVPETVAVLAAVLLTLRRPATLGRIPWPRLFFASLGLVWIALLVSSVFGEVDPAFLTRIVVLQYAVPTLFFFLVLRHVRSLDHARWAIALVTTSAGILFALATPVYFWSFANFPPAGSIPWPASRIIYNRMLMPRVHNDPKMLYDNVTFGNFLSVGQLLVVLLPLAAVWLYLGRTRLSRLVAAGSMAVFLLHLFLTYSRGAILCTLATVAATVGVFWLARHRSRWVVTALALAFVATTFGSPDVPRYWREQVLFLQGSSSGERIGFALRPLDFHAFMRGDRRAQYDLDPALVHELAAHYTRMLTVGLGHGTYGRLIGMGPDAGTHNMFVDALVSTGPMGLLGLIGLLVWAGRNFAGGLGRVWRPASGPGAVLAFFAGGALINVATIGVLSLYAFQYLRTSTGAIMFWLLLGLSVVVSRARSAEAAPASAVDELTGQADETLNVIERACP